MVLTICREWWLLKRHHILWKPDHLCKLWKLQRRPHDPHPKAPDRGGENLHLVAHLTPSLLGRFAHRPASVPSRRACLRPFSLRLERTAIRLPQPPCRSLTRASSAPTAPPSPPTFVKNFYDVSCLDSKGCTLQWKTCMSMINSKSLSELWVLGLVHIRLDCYDINS